MERQTEFGSTIIEDAVLATIAAEAALATDGVVALGTRRWVNGSVVLIRHPDPSRGVKVTALDDGGYQLDLYVVLLYGVKIGRVGRILAERVHQALTEAVGVAPLHIVIHVEGVRRRDDAPSD
ncbi:alkaline-shock protein [Sulfobacillus acidophilus TPY]|jgi:uncharacterized alkaline shock family protein YloU|uniref:Asp23/Gls24 family envelope stress response protein n=1 Tax=Sulfobacillus acidophilus (strain ATCC 700253 / DSM 10332 / NAL) TaxID=679936 RepID=G8TW39_SULAD|nr:alkaline-shock protein [Sulfobacillus acidophilus TPY]AEW05966.1 protein of unknown function DUF322 [Sulfobacillus acidophilus DSM 10332]MCY0864453.1 Asp23/Gls24 family envelope stress response protein [Sulfobacillus sp.]